MDEKSSLKELGASRKVLIWYKGFSYDPGRTDLIEHDIEIIPEELVSVRRDRTLPRLKEVSEQILREIEIEKYGSSPIKLIGVPEKISHFLVDYQKRGATNPYYSRYIENGEKVVAVLNCDTKGKTRKKRIYWTEILGYER